MGLHYTAGAVLALLPAVVARRSGGGGGGGGIIGSGSAGGGSAGGGSSDTADDTVFVAPPLEIANLAVNAILLLATLIQFLIVARALLHANTRSPAAGVVITLIVAIISYVLGVVDVVKTYTLRFDNNGFPLVSGAALIPIQTASKVLFDLKDPVLFAAIALVLQNRYRSLEKSPPVPIVFTSVACFLPLMMIVFIGADAGINETTILADIRHETSPDEVQSRFATSGKLFDTYAAFQILGSIFLAISAFLVKARTKGDRIMSLTLSVVIPLFLVSSLARLIFIILMQRLPLSDSYTIDVTFALDFSTTVVYGLLFTAITSVLVFLLFRVRLWGPEPLAVQSALSAQGASVPQIFVQGPPPAQGTSQPQFVGQGTPLAQFPGQWGYPQLQPQAGYPQQQYAYVPVHPVQYPGTQPPPAMTGASLAPAPPA